MGHPVLGMATKRTLEGGGAGELAEDVLQDASVLVVEDLLRGVDADDGREGRGVAGVRFGGHGNRPAIGELALEHGGQLSGLADGVELLAGEAVDADRVRVLAGLELQGQDAHADQV